MSNKGLLLIILIIQIIFLNAQICTKTIRQVTYNYDRFTYPPESPHNVTDIHTEYYQQINNTFYFNFCTLIKPVQIPAENVDCSITKSVGCVDSSQKTGDSHVFLVNHNNGECNRLSSGQNDYTIRLVDEQDPSKGIQFSYKGGDKYCHRALPVYEGELNVNLRFICSRTHNHFTLESIPTINLDSYTLTLKSKKACPISCSLSGDSLCSNHGMCGWDIDNNIAKCFCNDGYTGSSCQTKKKSTTSPMIISIVFIALLVISLAATVTYICLKLRKLTYNPDAFDTLEKKFNELGQLSNN